MAFNKYVKQKQQWSTDGITWYDVEPYKYRPGKLIELDSEDCDYYSFDGITIECLGDTKFEINTNVSGVGNAIYYTLNGVKDKVELRSTSKETFNLYSGDVLTINSVVKGIKNNYYLTFNIYALTSGISPYIKVSGGIPDVFLHTSDKGYFTDDEIVKIYNASNDEGIFRFFNNSTIDVNNFYIPLKPSEETHLRYKLFWCYNDYNNVVTINVNGMKDIVIDYDYEKYGKLLYFTLFHYSVRYNRIIFDKPLNIDIRNSCYFYFTNNSTTHINFKLNAKTFKGSITMNCEQTASLSFDEYTINCDYLYGSIDTPYRTMIQGLPYNNQRFYSGCLAVNGYKVNIKEIYGELNLPYVYANKNVVYKLDNYKTTLPPHLREENYSKLQNPEEHPFYTQPFTIYVERNTSRTTTGFIIKNISNDMLINLNNYGWKPYNETDLTILNNGDTIQIKSKTKGKNIDNCPALYRKDSDYPNYEYSVSQFYYGNVNSLYAGDDFLTDLTVYKGMFREWLGTYTNISRLVFPYMKLAEQMFYSFNNDHTISGYVPALPATELAPYCYAYMFYKCDLKLEPYYYKGSDAEYCYDRMFYQNNNMVETLPEKKIHFSQEYVDLDLPSGIKWATCDLGSDNGYESILLFNAADAIGQTEDQYVVEYDVPYHYANGYDKNVGLWSKYTAGDLNSSTGSADNKKVIEPTDDAATKYLGGSWRIPTYEDYVELVNNTTREYIEDYEGTGINVVKVKSKVDETKFIIFERGRTHWTSTLGEIQNTTNPTQYNYFYDIYFTNSTYYFGQGSRDNLLVIRPVRS